MSSKEEAKTELESMSDEERRKILKPDPSNEEIIQLMKTHFAEDSTKEDSVVLKKELDSYDDRNFWMTISGKDYLVKIHNGVESQDFCQALEKGNRQDSVIQYQYTIMKALGGSNDKDSQIEASCPVFPKSNSNGDETVFAVPLPVVSKAHSPYKLVVSVFHWVPGMTMSSLKVLPLECLADAGRFLGRIHQTWDKNLDSSTLKAAKRFHQWDGKNTKELSGFLHCIHDEQRRAMVQDIITTFDKELIQSDDVKFRTGIIHGDFNDANILLDGKFKVTGVIDFGDSLESWTVLDVSVAMAYAMLSTYGKAHRAISAAAAFLRGFHSVYPLTEMERQKLVLLIAVRLSCSVTLGAYSYQQNPENKYLLLHAEPAWEALEFVWGRNNETNRNKVGNAMKALFDIACESCKADDSGVIDCSDLTLADAYLLELQNTLSENKRKRHKPTHVVIDDGKKVITFVTGNKKKLEEVKRILLDDNDPEQSKFTLTNAKIDLPELQGDPLEIAKEKCEAAAKVINGAVITEDTSLCFTALKELPGPYIKWFLDKLGHDGLNKMIEAYDDKSAYAQTVVAYCEGPGKEVLTFDGRTMGKIVPARGKLDFGWDPIFEPDEGAGKTYAEMDKDEKDSMSHRSRAFAKLKAALLKQV